MRTLRRVLVKALGVAGAAASLSACSDKFDNGDVSSATSVPSTSVPATSTAPPTGPSNTPSSSSEPGVFSLSSPSLANSPDCSATTPEACGVFAPDNTSYMGNMNQSPELSWSNVPTGTASFALTFKDVSFGQPHWAIWNIPANLTMLPAGIPNDSTMPALPSGASQTNATFADGDGYFGPQAPCNVYEFVLYALAVATFTPTKPEFVALVGDELEALGTAVLGRTTLSGRNFVAGECQ